MADKRSKTEIFNDYEAFVDKFKPKRTTDDCYTPPEVYDAVRRWVNDNILALDGVQVVRPFFPGGDYEHFDYPENCVVIDNPPFSILAQIRRFYTARGIRYFLFAPALTCANSARELDETIIVCGANIVYANEAKISTSFLTNLPCGDTGIWCAGSLHHAIKKAIDALSRGKKPPTYFYPPMLPHRPHCRALQSGGSTCASPKPTISAPTGSTPSERAAVPCLVEGGCSPRELPPRELPPRELPPRELPPRELGQSYGSCLSESGSSSQPSAKKYNLHVILFFWLLVFGFIVPGIAREGSAVFLEGKC